MKKRGGRGKKKENILNPPNALSLLRIILIPFLIIQILGRNQINATILLALIIITDFLDGYLARKYGWETDFGTTLDAISDFAYYLGTLLAFYTVGWLGWINSILFLVAVILLIIFLIKTYKFNRMKQIPHLASGKIMACLLVASLFFILWQVRFSEWLLTITFLYIFIFSYRDHMKLMSKHKK